MGKHLLVEQETFDKKTMAGRIFDQLMEWIMDGKFEMGQRLSTDELAKELNVSRMPVRDAIKELERKGLIENIPYKGASLVNLTSDDVYQLYLLRSLIEPVICWYACKNATDEEIIKVGQVLEAFKKAMTKKDITAVDVFRYNREFHYTLYKTSKMNKMIDIVSKIWDNLAFCKLIYGQNYVTDPKLKLKQSQDHEEYFELFKNRKADELKALVTKNLENFEEIMPKFVTEKKK